MGSPITLRATTDSGMTTNNPTLQTTPTDDQFTNNGGRVDAVYIVATPGEIAFIKPMIAMRNGSQSGATLYASSAVRKGPLARISDWRWKACSTAKSRCWQAVIYR